MRTACAILLLIGLLASPVGCFASCPWFHHECCSKPSSTAICAYDILSVAKAALPAIAPIDVLPVAPTLVSITLPRIGTPPLDSGDLYLANRVLRI